MGEKHRRGKEVFPQKKVVFFYKKKRMRGKRKIKASQGKGCTYINTSGFARKRRVLLEKGRETRSPKRKKGPSSSQESFPGKEGQRQR